LENAKKVKEFIKKDIIAVVKADAYGHDSLIISKSFEELHFIKILAVATAEEGKQLRENGIKKEILVLGGILKEELDCFNRYRLTPLISDFEDLNTIQHLKDKSIHLNFDTGMGRLGFYKENIDDIVRFIKHNKIKVKGLMTHFPSADIDKNYTENQIKQFKYILKTFEQKGISPKIIHCQNSAGLIYKCDFCNYVRVGLVLYGEKPYKDFPVEVENIMYVKSRLISIKNIEKGKSISYCGTFVAPDNMKVGIISFGYADGLPRALSNNGYVLINGKKAYIIGNITMDMTIVDLTGIDAKVGDEVVIVGKSGEEEIEFSDIAYKSNTIPYEIMCGISKRVKRIKKVRNGTR